MIVLPGQEELISIPTGPQAHAPGIRDNNIEDATQARYLNEKKDLPSPVFTPTEPASHILKLPGEVLSVIFFTLVVEDWDEEGVLNAPGSSHSSLQSHRVPWTLAQVCSQWRGVAVCSQELWSYIVIRPDHVPMTKAGVDQVFLVVKTMLERSQSWPLHLSLKAMGDNMDAVLMFNHWLSVLKLLMEHSNRWKVTRFMLSAIFVKHLDMVKDRIDQLEECSISVREAIDDVHERFDMLNGSQTLRKLDVWNLPLMPTTTPWPNLTHYSGGFFPFTQLKLIEMMPMLSHLKISRVSATVLTPITCNRLTEVWIPDHSAIFLESLILPSLQTLRVGRVRRLDSITSVLKRSGCALRTLDITVIETIAIDAIRSLLEVLPSLTTLSIQDKAFGVSGMNSFLFEILSPYLPAQPLIPSLLDLSVRFSYRSDEWAQSHDDAFKTFVQSRWSKSFYLKRPVARLKRVHVEVVSGPHTDIPVFLEKLRKEGLETSFQASPASSFLGCS